jgi:hypothetical protein
VIAGVLGRAPEASAAPGPLAAGIRHNGFLSAARAAFDAHYPLVLSPDAVWLAVAQGFARHVEANAEALRPRLVRHAGRPVIAIRRDDLVKGSPDNAWPEVFGAFSDALAAHLGKARDLLVCDFSTTGPVERAASEIVLMDVVRPYFRYEVGTVCGIPEIALEGQVSDWAAVRDRARALGEYGCAWWVEALAPVLEQFVAAARGEVDRGFWQSLYGLRAASGGPRVSGWINAFFPYVRDARGGFTAQNPRARGWHKGEPEGVTADDFPPGCAEVPFRWVLPARGLAFEMAFAGGFVGVSQEPDALAVRPAIGWGVLDAAPATRTCAACGVTSPSRARFCTKCGGPLAAG